jgi:hypothetical protein
MTCLRSIHRSVIARCTLCFVCCYHCREKVYRWKEGVAYDRVCLAEFDGSLVHA